MKNMVRGGRDPELNWEISVKDFWQTLYIRIGRW